MNEWVNEWMNEWISEWVNEWMSEWMNEWVNEWMSEWINEWMNEWMNEWVSEWVSEWMNEWVNEWMNEWITKCKFSCVFNNLDIFCICSEWYPVSTHYTADGFAYSWYAKPFLSIMISTKSKTLLWVGKHINYSFIFFLEVSYLQRNSDLSMASDNTPVIFVPWRWSASWRLPSVNSITNRALGPFVLRRRNLETEFSLWRRNKCFPSTPNWRI